MNAKQAKLIRKVMGYNPNEDKLLSDSSESNHLRDYIKDEARIGRRGFCPTILKPDSKRALYQAFKRSR